MLIALQIYVKHMSDLFVKALDPQLDRIAPKKNFQPQINCIGTRASICTISTKNTSRRYQKNTHR